MKKICFPYGKEHLEHTFGDGELSAVLTSSIEEYIPDADGDELVERALREPIGSAPLCELARGKNNVVVIALLPKTVSFAYASLM